MRLHVLPVLKPYQKYGAHQEPSTYIQPGDYVETRSGSGEVEEIRYGADNCRQFRLEGQRRWHDEQHFLNQLDFAGYSWMNMRRGSI